MVQTRPGVPKPPIPKQRIRRAAGGALIAGIAALLPALVLANGVNRLLAFNALMPKDGGSRMMASASYGTLSRQGLDIYGPIRPQAAHLPVIVFIYGGSWDSGERQGYGFVGRALAARGFIVVVPDYRLVPDIRYPVFLQDNAAAVHWVRAHIQDFGGDASRLVLLGHSAGAYNAAMLALDPRWLGADRGAVRAFIGLAGPYDFLPFTGAATEAFKGAPDLAETQPVHYARPDAPPALLVTGQADTIVRPRNSDELARVLDAKGVPAQRLRYPGIGHIGLITAFAKPLRWRVPVLNDVVTFAKAQTQKP